MKSEIAAQLGRMNKGKKKNLSPEAREAKRLLMKEICRKRDEKLAGLTVIVLDDKR